MKIIKKSKTSFVKYKPFDDIGLFNIDDGKGGYYTSNICSWKLSQFYLAKSFDLEDFSVAFASKSLSNVAEKLMGSVPVDNGVVLQQSEESFLDIYMFNMNLDSVGNYGFSDFLLEFNLNDSEIQGLIDAINEGRWRDIKLTVFFDEISLLSSLRDAEESKFNNYAFRITDFTISY